MNIGAILTWTIVAAIVLALVTNAGGVAQIIGSFGKFWVTETGVLAGSNPNQSAYYKAA